MVWCKVVFGGGKEEGEVGTGLAKVGGADLSRLSRSRRYSTSVALAGQGHQTDHFSSTACEQLIDSFDDPIQRLQPLDAH